MARVRRSYEVAIDYDRRILHPRRTSGFSVRLHDQFGVSHAVIEPRHATASNDLRAGSQHRSSTDASDDSAARADVLHELGYARIFRKQGRAFRSTRNEDAHIVLGPDVRYRALDVQQAGPREVAVNLDRLLARGHHLHLVAGFVEGDLRKEVLLLLKRVSDEGCKLWALISHPKSPSACAREPCRIDHRIGMRGREQIVDDRVGRGVDPRGLVVRSVGADCSLTLARAPESTAHARG